MSASDGVQPLVCVVCEKIVGAINTHALARMFGTGEAYICHACAKIDDPKIEVVLAAQPRDFYAHLVSRAMVAAELEMGRAPRMEEMDDGN